MLELINYAEKAAEVGYGITLIMDDLRIHVSTVLCDCHNKQDC